VNDRSKTARKGLLLAGVGEELVHSSFFGSFGLVWFWFGLGVGVWKGGTLVPWKSLGVDRRAGKTRI